MLTGFQRFHDPILWSQNVQLEACANISSYLIPSEGTGFIIAWTILPNRTRFITLDVTPRCYSTRPRSSTTLYLNSSVVVFYLGTGVFARF